MPQPGLVDVHVDAILTNILIAYMQDADNFVASRVFPIVPVAKKSDKYFTYDRTFWFREEAQLRAPSTESAGGGWGVSTDSYTADVYAFHKDIDDQVRANQDSPLNMDRDAAKFVAQQLLLKLESLWTAAYMVGGNVWTGTASAVDQTGVNAAPGANQFLQWDDPASTPIEDVSRYSDEMGEKTGKRPNKLVIGPRVFTALRNHPDIIDRIKYTQRGLGLTEALVAEALDVDEVLVARATHNTAAEGVAGAYSYYTGKVALLAYAAAAPSLMEPSAGYMFGWTGYTGVGGVEGIGTGSRVNRMRLPWLNSDRIEGEMALATKVVAPELGIYLASAVA